MRSSTALPALLTAALLFASATFGQTPGQPKVTPGPQEPDWVVILDKMYGLSMFGDLKNPVKTTALETPGLFKKAGPGPVMYRPLIALGLVTVNRGGWYRPGEKPEKPESKELWSYQVRNTTEDVETGTNLPPKLFEGSKIEFDPGDAPFGIWVANDGLKDGGVFSQPKVVKAVNARLARQPYKAMIYPYKDKATGKIRPNAYLIGWEYSTNDDFQDVVCLVENAVLLDEL